MLYKIYNYRSHKFFKHVRVMKTPIHTNFIYNCGLVWKNINIFLFFSKRQKYIANFAAIALAS